jgi:RNase P/RNase MRP subunit POP5
MVVKELRGRRRYIYFRMNSYFDKETLIRRLYREFDKESIPYVVQCNDGEAIIRCPPEQMEPLKQAISHIDPTSESVTTSGTLKTIRDKYPSLKSTSRKG